MSVDRHIWRRSARWPGGAAPIALLTAGLAGAALDVAPAAAATPADTLVIARQLDGALTMDTGQIAEGDITQTFQSVCDGLALRDPSDPLKMLPGVAESWQVSPDGKVITFKIRDGLKHRTTGNPVTAYDAAWSTQRVLKLGFGTAAELQQWNFKKDQAETAIKATDARTLVVTMDQPYPIDAVIYSAFTDRPGFVLDSEEIKQHDVGGDLGNKWMQQRTLCVGPFFLVTWKQNEVLVFERDDQYYGKKPPLKRFLIRHASESGAQRLLVEKGDVDVAMNLNETDTQALMRNPDIKVQDVIRHSYIHMAFNNSHPIFKDTKVVNALRYLIDYEGLSKTILTGDVVRHSLVPIGAFGALSEKDGAPFKLDLDKAKMLLAEAGYPNGFSAALWSSNNPGHPEIAQHIQANAAKIGVNFDLQVKTSGELFPKYRAREYDAVLVGWAALYPDADAMVSRHAYNPDNRLEGKLTHFPSWRAAWADPWFNEMTEKARFERDPEKRKQLYYDIQRRHMVESPFIYIVQNNEQIAVRKNVQDVQMLPFATYYKNASKN